MASGKEISYNDKYKQGQTTKMTKPMLLVSSWLKDNQNDYVSFLIYSEEITAKMTIIASTPVVVVALCSLATLLYYLMIFTGAGND